MQMRYRGTSMPSLRDAQRRFAASLFAPAGANEPGLAVYQRNLRGNFAKVLALEFPVVQKLVGGDYFQSLAWQFQQVEPSRSGNLHGIGATFASFLRGRFGGGNLGYLGDVADVEWAVEQSLIAADADAAFDLNAFAAAPADQHERLRFELHPALRLVRSRYPIVTLWHSHMPDSDGAVAAHREDFRLDLSSGGENACVLRSAADVSVTALSDAEAGWLDAITQRATLGDALESAMERAPSGAAFDLGALLSRGVRDGWFIGFSVA